MPIIYRRREWTCGFRIIFLPSRLVNILRDRISQYFVERYLIAIYSDFVQTEKRFVVSRGRQEEYRQELLQKIMCSSIDQRAQREGVTNRDPCSIELANLNKN